MDLDVKNTKIQFYKLDENWYADVPNHTLAENRMVAGADLFLDILDYSHCGKVILDVSNRKNGFSKDPDFKLKRIHHDRNGATYYVKKINDRAPRIRPRIPFLWLCNVVHDVLGEHWNTIYIWF